MTFCLISTRKSNAKSNANLDFYFSLFKTILLLTASRKTEYLMHLRAKEVVKKLEDKILENKITQK